MLATACFAQSAAFCKKIQRVVHDPELQHVLRSSLDLHDPRVTELKHLFAVGADKMVVLAVLVRLLELRHVLSELVLHHQPGAKQDLDIVIQSGPAYPVLLVLHHEIQLLDVEMPFVRIYLIKDRESLRGLPVLVNFQVICQNFSNRFLRILVHCDFKDTII